MEVMLFLETIVLTMSGSLILDIIFFEYRIEHSILDIMLFHTDPTPFLVRNSTLLSMHAPTNGVHCLIPEEHGATRMKTAALEDFRSFWFWT